MNDALTNLGPLIYRQPVKDQERDLLLTARSAHRKVARHVMDHDRPFGRWQGRQIGVVRFNPLLQPTVCIAHQAPHFVLQAFCPGRIQTVETRDHLADPTREMGPVPVGGGSGRKFIGEVLDAFKHQIPHRQRILHNTRFRPFRQVDRRTLNHQRV